MGYPVGLHKNDKKNRIRPTETGQLGNEIKQNQNCALYNSNNYKPR